MTSPKDPIWGTPAGEANWAGSPDLYHVDSPRCGGSYCILEEEYSDFKVKDSIERLGNREKAKLTLWLAQQRKNGIDCPTITHKIVKYIKQKNNLSASDRADEILKYIARKTDEMQNNYYNLLILSESINGRELDCLLKYLKQREWIQKPSGSSTICCLTIEGYERLAKIQRIETDSSKGFMTMWFNVFNVISIMWWRHLPALPKPVCCFLKFLLSLTLAGLLALSPRVSTILHAVWTDLPYASDIRIFRKRICDKERWYCGLEKIERSFNRDAEDAESDFIILSKILIFFYLMCNRQKAEQFALAFLLELRR